ncbi:MAG: cysteine--tRNA ligase [Candidatus Diapherotrites archaeon]|uniref:Cysteine--tRNA ligase n=1 Tax=Candidatus Iainarchaeum sp. TaxID=3101447 RepID=A0A8T4L851_9ARCH|nr:cysteine--tRNA ligase [Candidatus Diapherotrites archaeon]
MLRVQNTLSKQLEDFKPLKDREVRMYVCGPTVYGPGHIGHARTYTAFDVIRRYLEYSGYKVRYVVNLTDVHDDMIKRANEQGITIFELAEKNIKLFFKDMDALGIKPANENPRVTEHIKEIIDTIQALEKNGFAYETEDGVYYSVTRFKGYGRLSGIKLDKRVTGTRVETDKYEKENVTDFALWKKAKPGEPSWESPWGQGRPGWHIECSVMARKHLGEQLDIHGGAIDLIFPHHENEIAQSEAAFGKAPFVKYWLHTGFLNVKGEKMSKSLGNYITIPELLARYDPKVFRFFIANVHYRSRIDFSEDAMAQAKAGLEKFNRLIEALQEVKGGKDHPAALHLVNETRTAFTEHMDADFNTPNAFATLFNFVSEANKLLAEAAAEAAAEATAETALSEKDAKALLDFLREINQVFNCFSFERAKAELPAEAKKLLDEREAARKAKDFKKSDEFRAKLRALGIELDDTRDGVKWRKVA